MKSLITILVAGLFFSIASQAGAPPKKTPELLEVGKAAYAESCVLCHGVKADGMGDAGKYMNPKPRNFAKDSFTVGKNAPTVTQVYNAITKGLPNTLMAGFPAISDEKRWALAYYVLSFREKK